MMFIDIQKPISILYCHFFVKGLYEAYMKLRGGLAHFSFFFLIHLCNHARAAVFSRIQKDSADTVEEEDAQWFFILAIHPHTILTDSAVLQEQIEGRGNKVKVGKGLKSWKGSMKHHMDSFGIRLYMLNLSVTVQLIIR